MFEVICQHPYQIHVNRLSTETIRPYLPKHYKIALICDSTVYARYQDNVIACLKQLHPQFRVFTFPAGEQAKTRETKATLEDHLFAEGFGRDTCLIALGGGVTLDLVGFLASTFCRGVPYVSIPTTLLAMVDVVVGGKTAVNTPAGKNLVGTFNTPLFAWLDIHFLQSLPSQDWANGVSEMIKHAVIASPPLFELLKQHSLKSLQSNRAVLEAMILKNCQIKAQVIRADEFENSYREILNFGHTIGHAIESHSQYQIPHGLAVAQGMLVEAKLAQQLGLFASRDYEWLIQLLKQYGLPTTLIIDIPAETLMHLLYQDKKTRANQVRVTLLSGIGKVTVQEDQYALPVAETSILQAWNACRAVSRPRLEAGVTE